VLTSTHPYGGPCWKDGSHTSDRSELRYKSLTGEAKTVTVPSKVDICVDYKQGK
jgi:hypothetical protein